MNIQIVEEMERYPFSIVDAGNVIEINNGTSGQFSIRKEFIAIDPCLDVSVLSDNSDIDEGVKLIDVQRTKTHLPKITTMLIPKEFGYETKDELINAINEIVERDVRLDSCFSYVEEETPF